MEYEIGLDLGVQSIGWSVKAGDKLVKLGVHCFESGTGTADDIEKGKDASRNADRQAARSLRRQLQRRSQRSVAVARALQKAGLLPIVDQKGVPYNVGLAENRDRLIKDLDWELFSKFINEGDRVESHLLPYLLRARALDKKLEPYELGRALYHLAQRRGYLSNRKAVKESEEDADGDDDGKVKAGISELESKIKTLNCRTLGEYFSKIDPEDDRIRQRYTSRQMYLDEFDKIWKKQAKFNPNLTDEAKKTIHHAIFFQRPLKSMRSKLGKCELVPGKRRAPVACLEFQRFRYWQKILDLKYMDDGDWRELTPEELDLLAKELELNESLTFTDIKNLLGLKRNVKINLAEGGEKKIRGNVTAARLRKAIPDRWDAMSENEQADLVNEILQFEREEALKTRLIKVFHFTSTEAQKIASTFLENGWAMYSKAALGKLLPYMRDNRKSFATATKELFNIQKKQSEPLDFLPPVETELGQIRNPVVTRTLTELRKVVNSIIRHAKKEGWGGEYGKPSRIFIELARDMKKSRKQREQDYIQNRKKEKEREIARKIVEDAGIKDPRPNDILKVLLAIECNWRCPYTDKNITPANLLGDHPQFDIEHILPFSRSLDNSFANKTLCDAKYNRDVKRNQTPYECASGDPQKYHDILERVKRFSGGAPGRGGNPKLRRFQMTEIPDGFANRVLNDTRYISRLACDYLGTLYGGQIDRTDVETDSDVGKRRIFVCTGQATAWVRREWDLNKILNDGDEKERTDHRHHAVDAAAIVYCSPEVVRKLASAAEQAEELNDKRRLFLRGEINEPYRGYRDDVAALVDEINVSYRCNKKVSGPLHKETNYSKAHIEIDPKTGKEVEYRYLRKPLASMSVNDIQSIVDPVIREIVLEKLSRLGGKPNAFANENELPYRMVKSKDGSQRLVPIKKARFRQVISVKKIGKGANERFVATGGNHHMEVYALLDKNGRETKWIADTVTFFDAYERLVQHQPIVNRDHGPNTVYKFTLYKNDFLLLTTPNGETVLKRIYKFSGQELGWGDHNDARPAAEVTGTKGNRPKINSLRGLVQKVSIDFWGDIHPAND